MKIANKKCCTEFNPELWHEKEMVWKNKLFVKARICSFMYIPLNFCNTVKRNMVKIDKEGARSENFLILTDENSLWGADVYIATNKNVEGLNNVTLSGTFLTKVYEGNCKNIGKWMKDMRNYVYGKGKDVNKMFFWYTTCPKCFKIFNNKFIVFFVQT